MSCVCERSLEWVIVSEISRAVVSMNFLEATMSVMDDVIGVKIYDSLMMCFGI